MRKQPVALLLASILASSSAHAADAVRWEDLPKKIGTGYGRQYTVVTRDGNSRKGIALAFRPQGVLLNDSVHEISRDDVSEIRIHHHLAFDAASGRPMDRLFSAAGYTSAFAILFVLAIPIYVITAPPAIAVEGIRRMLPDKVIKVAP